MLDNPCLVCHAFPSRMERCQYTVFIKTHPFVGSGTARTDPLCACSPWLLVCAWLDRHKPHQFVRYHYPAIIQGADGTIHAVYSYFVEGGKSMKHAAFNEDWINAGDAK